MSAVFFHIQNLKQDEGVNLAEWPLHQISPTKSYKVSQPDALECRNVNWQIFRRGPISTTVAPF